MLLTNNTDQSAGKMHKKRKGIIVAKNTRKFFVKNFSQIVFFYFYCEKKSEKTIGRFHEKHRQPIKNLMLAGCFSPYMVYWAKNRHSQAFSF